VGSHKPLLERALLLLVVLSFGILSASAQRVIKTDEDVYTVSLESTLKIAKSPINSKRVLFTAEAKIPDDGEAFNPGANDFSLELVGDKIVVVYDVWNKSTKTEDCSLLLLDVQTGKFDARRPIYSTKLNTVFSCADIPHRAIYSPDTSKLLILKDNISPGYDIDPELTIYDTKTFELLSTKEVSGQYEGQKRIIDLSQTSMDNDGNITTVLHLVNEKTKITTKSFTAKIPFQETGLTELTALEENASDDSGDGRNSLGRFYKTFDDYVNAEPMPGVRVKNGSISAGVAGTSFALVDDEGNTKREGPGDFPSDLFTYRASNYSSPEVIRIMNKKPYLVLVAGPLCHYASYTEQQKRYYAEGWKGELEGFSENKFEKYLEKFGLLADYEKDKPKREFKDDVNDYYNKEVAWQVKYFVLINEKM